MSSGYGDAEKLRAALELAQSFKGEKSDTYGGVKSKHSENSSAFPLLTNAQESKKKNATSQPYRPIPPPPKATSARGTPNVSIRNYPNAGNFVARESNISKGPPVMKSALDFLNRQDKPADTSAHRKSFVLFHHLKQILSELTRDSNTSIDDEPWASSIFQEPTFCGSAFYWRQ